MHYYFYDFNDNYQSFDDFEAAKAAAKKEGLNKFRCTNFGEYFI